MFVTDGVFGFVVGGGVRWNRHKKCKKTSATTNALVLNGWHGYLSWQSSIAAQGLERFENEIDDQLHLGQIAMTFVADQVQASLSVRPEINIKFL